MEETNASRTGYLIVDIQRPIIARRGSRGGGGGDGLIIRELRESRYHPDISAVGKSENLMKKKRREEIEKEETPSPS